MRNPLPEATPCDPDPLVPWSSDPLGLTRRRPVVWQAPSARYVCPKESAMRPAIVAGLVTLALSAAAPAQTGPYLAVVAAEKGVLVRSGPSDSYPDTSTLPRGTHVVVERDAENGWLEIKAPPGSVSWVP